jgi:hypothetical protein
MANTSRRLFKLWFTGAAGSLAINRSSNEQEQQKGSVLNHDTAFIYNIDKAIFRDSLPWLQENKSDLSI